MKTELEIVAPNPVGGAKIQVHSYLMRNKPLHAVLETISRMANAMLELDAANSGSGMSRAETRDLQDDWSLVKHEWERAVANAGLPASGGHETGLMITFLTQTQILSVGNVRVRRVLNALSGLVERILSADSAKQEYDVQTKDQEYIARHMTYVEEVLNDYVGTVDGDAFNRGLEVSAHTHLGTVVPPENLGYADSFEPSHEAASGPVADVADSASGIPAPNSRPQ